MRVVRWVALTGAVLGLACATGSQYRADTVHAAPGVTDADLFSATVHVFSERGFVLREKDAEAGVVATEWQKTAAGTAFQSSTMELAWHAVIGGGGFRLLIDCREQIGDDWKDCGDTRLTSWTDRAPAITNEIQDEAGRRARQRQAPASQPTTQP